MNNPLVIARCGDLENAPENTLSAFDQAIAKGADAIEFDVHQTKDGALVVHHDYYLGRTDNGSGYIGEFSLAELKMLDAGSWFSKRYQGERIPTLQDVLTLGKGKTRFEIDLKASSLEFLQAVLDEIVRFDVATDVELTTAHVPLLFHARRLNPVLRVGTFFYPLPDWMKPSLGQKHIIDWAGLADIKVVHLHSSLIEEEFINQLHEKGFLIHGSNLNDEYEMDKGIAAGIDQFSTDRLEFALQKTSHLNS